MEKSSKVILSIAGTLGIIGSLNFILLCLHFSFWLNALVSIVLAIAFCKWIMKQEKDSEKPHWFPFIIFLAGTIILTNKVYYIAPKHGLWDAWSIWNLHAKYLADSKHWKQLFLNDTYCHPDYPMLLPSVIAFFSKLSGHFSLLVPYALHFLITLSIPTLIFIETYKKNVLIAGLVFILFSVNEFYLMEGTSQLADTLLAFFFLCAIVCIQYKEQTKMVILSAFFAGCCAWTKNEGIIIAVVFILFNARNFLTKGRFNSFIAGISLPFLSLLILKIFFAPANDMVSGQNASSFHQLFMADRYKLIYDFFKVNLKLYFRDVKMLIIIYFITCIIYKQLLDKQFFIIIFVAGIYTIVYILSPHDLEWHLATSQSRLMHQLMPATLFLLSKHLSELIPDPVARFFSARQRPQ